MSRILIAEDEAHLLYFIRLNLESEGYEVECATDGQMAWEKFSSDGPFDLAIVDVNMPKMNGFDLVKKIRDTDDKVGIVILSARTTETDKLLGLSHGADDYIAKPFSLEQLQMKVKRMVKRATFYKSDAQSLLEFDSLQLDLDRNLLKSDTGEFCLTDIEASLLAEFMKSPFKVLNREEILKSVWAYSDSAETRTVDNFIVRLRKYIESNPSKPKRLLSIRGRGYKLVSESRSQGF